MVKAAIGKTSTTRLRLAGTSRMSGIRAEGRLDGEAFAPRPAQAALDGCLEGGLGDGTMDGFTSAAVPKSGRLAAAYLGGVRPTERPAPSPADDIRPIALVWDCVGGNPGAWDAFVRRYAPLILAIARRSLRARGLSPAPDDLEDICENTFLALVKDDFALLRSYDDRFALSTFLGVVARTQAGRFARRRRVGGSDVDVAELPSRVDDPAVAVEEGDLRAALRDTLDEMPERDRQILTLFYFSDRDYRAIAAELKISANSVGAALHRARERLKARLEARDRRSSIR